MILVAAPVCFSCIALAFWLLQCTSDLRQNPPRSLHEPGLPKALPACSNARSTRSASPQF